MNVFGPLRKSFESCLCVGSESTPIRVAPEETTDLESPGVSIIDQSPPAPILVSDASTTELPQTPKPAHPKSVRIQAPEKMDQDSGVQELFFNEDVRNPSDVEKSCPDDCRLNMAGTCSCVGVREKKAGRRIPLCQVIQESGASSLPDTGSGSWDADARATYYHHKLMSTLQILANKEETVRVQGESLRVAEARIASLTARAQRLRTELDEKAQELKKLQRSAEKCGAEKMDVSVTADAQELENQKNMVRTLQTNLSVIEDLYRECFYETAKQEELIEMLRKSCVDVRLMDKEKCDQIGRLQNVINTQKWSLEKCQDMAMEVEGLKLEILNFLSSSNNDSGMWERSEDSLSGEVAEDLQQITAQLLQLRAMLTGDCTCGLEEENMRLKELNEKLQIQVGELRRRVCELEAGLSEKESGDQIYRDEIAEKQQELSNVRQRLAELEEAVGDRKGTCDVLASQLRQAQVSIEDQTAELIEARRRCQGHEVTINQLNEELEKANHIIAEGRTLREEVGAMRRAVCDSGRRVSALADELAREHDRCRCLDACYREKAECAASLQAQLEQAHARGAALCGEVRRVAADVRRWLRRMRDRHRAQEDRIKELESLNSALQQRNLLGLIDLTNEPCSAKCVSLGGRRTSSRATETNEYQEAPVTESRDARRSGSGTARCERAKTRDQLKKDGTESCICNCGPRIEASGSNTCTCQDRFQNVNEYLKGERRSREASRSETVSCGCSRVMRGGRSRTSGSEAASSSSAPTPPRRLLKKKFSPTEEKVESWWWGGVRRREASAQQPQRRDATCDVRDAPREYHATHVRVARLPREESPSAQLEQRVSALHAALETSQRRWTRTS